MSDLTTKFTNLETQLNDDADEAHSQRVSIISSLEDIQSGIASINSDMLLMRQQLLSAIGQSAACFPCPTPSISVPTVTTGGTPIDSDRCKRSQAIIATIRDILAAMDTLMSYNVVATFNVLNDAISEVISSIAAGDTIPLPSFPEVTLIVTYYFSYVAEHIISGLGLVEQFSPIESDLVNAIFIAGSASGSQSSYESVIDGSSVSTVGKLLMKAVAYNALWSYFFDPDSTPDLSSFSGTACTGGLPDITTCTNFVSAFVTNAGHDYALVQTPPVYSGYSFAIAGDFYGWVFTATEVGGIPFTIYNWEPDNSGPNHWHDFGTPGVTFGFTTHTAAIMIVTAADDSHVGAFVVEVCPPS